MIQMRMIVIIVFAFILDLIFGDPSLLPHPICLIGNMIGFLEKVLRKIIHNELFAGILLSVIVLTFSFTVPFLILHFANKLNYYFALSIEIYFCYQIFAVKSLKTESMKVYHPLIKKDIKKARKFLSYIVGRDTQGLTEKSIIKATVETVAENTTDGVIAPLIFMAIGGAPLAFLYKAVNTLDSMIGYKNERYFYFGKFAARLDDIANYIPARVSAIFMIIATLLLRLDVKNALVIFFRDRKNHKSPNSAQTESVCAGALNVQLAGDAFYFGQPVNKPTIGDDNREINVNDIILANRLMYVTAMLGVMAVIVIKGILWLS